MRAYQYVGPPEVRAAEYAAAGRVIGTPDDLGAWLTGCDGKEALEPLTFVIDSSGILRLVPRRSEHVAGAGGGPVLSAGEMTFASGPDGWEVTEVTNLSTGYCPEARSWPAVARPSTERGSPILVVSPMSSSSAAVLGATVAIWSRMATSCAPAAAKPSRGGEISAPLRKAEAVLQ